MAKGLELGRDRLEVYPEDNGSFTVVTVCHATRNCPEEIGKVWGTFDTYEQAIDYLQYLYEYPFDKVGGWSDRH